MTTKETGGPAFPFTCPPEPDGSTTTYTVATLRDYFAAKALIAYHSDGTFSNPKDAAIWSYEIADAMLEARK